MRESEYRLQTVFDVREQARREAARLLAARREQLAAADAELARRARAIDECRIEQTALRRRMMDHARGGAAAGELVAYRARHADLRFTEEELRALVDAQHKVVARCADAVEDATAGLIEAAKELQVIEKHREDWRRQRALERERREQKSNDEIGTQRHTQRYTRRA